MRTGKFKKALDMGLQATVPLKPLNSRFRFLLGKVICYRKNQSQLFGAFIFVFLCDDIGSSFKISSECRVKSSSDYECEELAAGLIAYRDAQFGILVISFSE